MCQQLVWRGMFLTILLQCSRSDERILELCLATSVRQLHHISTKKNGVVLASLSVKSTTTILLHWLPRNRLGRDDMSAPRKASTQDSWLTAVMVHLQPGSWQSPAGASVPVLHCVADNLSSSQLCFLRKGNQQSFVG